MSDLIDRQALMESLGIKENCENCQYVKNRIFCAKSDDFIDVCEKIFNAPVVKQATRIIEDLPSAEPKKGRWIFARYYVWECSECGENPTKGMGYIQGRSELFRYCPYCGTEMEVKK